MKLSTRARYGIHAMVDLALYDGQGPQPLKAIADRQGIPEQYLEQLLVPLRREKLVSSVRGAQGGYMLARPPEEITMGTLMRILEGPISLADCLDGDGSCNKARACPTRLVWERLSQCIDNVLDSVTLRDLLDDQARLSAQGKENP